MADLTGTGISLFRAAGGSPYLEMFTFDVFGDVDGTAVTNTNVGYKNYIDSSIAFEQDAAGITKLFGQRALTKELVQAGEVVVHVSPNGAGVMEQTFNFPVPFAGASLPVVVANVVAMDGSTQYAHYWSVVPTALSTTQFKLKVINTVNTWGTDIKVQFMAMKFTSTL